MTGVLRVDGLAKHWDEHSGLPPVTFDAGVGEVVVVRGRSGSGKSTLLALIAGWCTPDAGAVELPDGVDVDRWEGIAVVPQVLALVPELTIAENVAEAFGGGREPAQLAAVARVVELLDLGELADRLPDDTSMGQRQRAAVARAIVGTPAVVLVDEPTSHQDPGHATVVIEALRACARAGAVVLVASHDDDVAAAADRVIDLSA